MMRRLSGVLGEFAGLLAGVAISLLFLGLTAGGLAYQKACITNDGRLETSWDFQWVAPIPYAFRPSGEQCVVHTGTRVALNAIGIFPYRSLAEKIAADTANPNAAYWARVSAVLNSFNEASAKADDIAAGRRAALDAAATLDGMSPPDVFADDHTAAARALHAYVSALGGIMDGEPASAPEKQRIRRAQRAYNHAIREMNVTWSIVKLNIP